MISEIQAIALAAGWGLRLHDDGLIELSYTIGDETFVLELGECTLPPTHPLEEGVNYLRSGGTSLSKPT